jgi:hypothetical protein
VTDRVTHEELLSFRRALLQDIPVALRVRLEDIDHLLGWPPPPLKPPELATDDELLAELDRRLATDAFKDDLELTLASRRLYLDHAPERAKRVWFMNGGHLRFPEKHWLCGVAGDEYGNRTAFLRVSPSRYLVVNLAFPLSHTLEEPTNPPNHAG